MDAEWQWHHVATYVLPQIRLDEPANHGIRSTFVPADWTGNVLEWTGVSGATSAAVMDQRDL